MGPDKHAAASCPPSDDPLCALALSAMTRARAALVMEHPFFGALALRLTLQEDSSCRDLWADGKTLGFNPAYAASLPEDKLIGAQAHEILHLAFGHHVRRKARDTGLWNRACDLAINQILLDTGFSLPGGFAHDPAYAGMSADDIFEILVTLQEEAANKGAKKNQQSTLGQEDADADGMRFDGGQELGQQSTAKGKDRTTDKQAEEEEASSGRLQGHASASAEEQGKTSAEKGSTEFIGEVRDHPGLEGLESDKARKTAEQEADIALTQAMQCALNMGSMPAGFLRLVKKEWRPALDWRELLRRFLENCADNDYSWTLPNRRYLHQEIYLPSRHEARLPHIALAVDCSGSVDEEALAGFCAELSSILDSYDTTLTVLFHDSKVQKEHTLSRMDLPFSLAPQGGGGTDFRPVCEHIAGQNMHPTCLVWFTDMECNLFPPAPDYPVLWVCSKPCLDEPPFGELVCMVSLGG